MKVDMEAKLRDWLESKGKTKSALRLGAFNSPSLGKTSSSISALKKQSVNKSFVIPKVTTNRDACDFKERYGKVLETCVA